MAGLFVCLQACLPSTKHVLEEVPSDRIENKLFEQFGFIAATFDEFQLIISEFDDLGLSVEIDHEIKSELSE